MIEIDGSKHSGSGTLLRYSAALSTLIGEPLHMFHIRSRRDKPGLRPQHLKALRACADFSAGRLEGDEVGAREITYHPGGRLSGGHFNWDIGTAGSTTMLAFTVLPLALFSEAPSTISITGGLFQDFAPSAFHMQKVLFPLIRRMGGEVSLEIVRPGYVPEGQGKLLLRVEPLPKPLEPLRMLEQGRVRQIRGISLSSHLDREQVSERMADECRRLLQERGLQPQMDIIRDSTAVQRGAALLLWAESEKGCLIGADQAGKRGRRSESIARFVVDRLLEDIDSGAATDRHLADQIILFSALARGRTEYLIPRLTDHIESNLWLTGVILGSKAAVEGNRIRIEGIGFKPRGSVS